MTRYNVHAIAMLAQHIHKNRCAPRPSLAVVDRLQWIVRRQSSKMDLNGHELEAPSIIGLLIGSGHHTSTLHHMPK